MMIRNKLALIRSAMLFVVCMFLFFPFPNNPLLTAGSSFMSFPIRYAKGVSLLGIAASLLFVTAILLLVIGLRKYHVRLVIAVLIVYALLPNIFLLHTNIHSQAVFMLFHTPGTATGSLIL